MDLSKLANVSPARASTTTLERAFSPWRAAVNGHRAIRTTLDGLTIGAIVGAATSTIAIVTHHNGGRFIGLGIAIVGAAAGAVVGRRRAWSDATTALYVDGVLGTPETVMSAITLKNDARDDLIEDAIAVLGASEPRAPRRVRRAHGFALAATIACVALLTVHPPAAAIAAPPVGTDVVKLVTVPGLDRAADVEKLPARDAEQKARLSKIAEDARALKKQLQEGMPRRDALDRLHALRDRLESERKELGGGEHKAGLDAAAQALKAGGLPGLADALEERDLQSIDEMTERIANAREDEDREKAKSALDHAIDEAKKQGADDVAKALEKQKERLQARSDKADALRDLEDALKGSSGDPGASGRRFDEQGTDGAARDLADALRKGLEKLTPEERERIAEKLRKDAEEGGSGDPRSGKSKQRAKDLAGKLKTPEGQRQLEKQLRDLAKGEDGEPGDDRRSDEERRQRGLQDGEDGTDDAGKGLGEGSKGGSKSDGKPGSGSGGASGDGSGAPGVGESRGQGGDEGAGAGGQGGGEGGGDGDHKGHTHRLDAETLKARARGHSGAGGALQPGASIERVPGQDGASATVRSSGDGKAAPADEVRGVDRAEVPEGVRRQVKAYFE